MPLTKDPAEIVTITFDFSLDATAISNPSISVAVRTGKNDPSPETMIFGAAQVAGTNVMQRVQGGVSGTTYQLRCIADDVDGERYVRSDTLLVSYV